MLLDPLISIQNLFRDSLLMSPHAGIQSLVDRQRAFGYASCAESEPDSILPRATIRCSDMETVDIKIRGP